MHSFTTSSQYPEQAMMREADDIAEMAIKNGYRNRKNVRYGDDTALLANDTTSMNIMNV